jgi:hypothetical protein
MKTSNIQRRLMENAQRRRSGLPVTKHRSSFAQPRDLSDKLKADKGEKNGSCNLTACQRPGATFYNKSTQRYYCADCAREINWPGGRADTMALYGVPMLCEHED